MAAKIPEPTDTSQTAQQIDVETFASNLARLIEESGKAAAAYLKPREAGEINGEPALESADMVKTLGQVAQWWMSDPARAIEAQAALAQTYMDVWMHALRRLAGEATEPAGTAIRDSRFKDEEWTSNPFFDLIRRSYLATTRWAEKLVEDAEGLDPHTRHKAMFYMHQITNAMAPSNFVITNPELLRETLKSKGENLVRGMKMLTEDIEAGKGELKIRQVDASKFELGVNLATTPGKVVFENALMQLIQYEPATKQVYKRPLLICPPWINKFYILDLNPEKSFIGWCVAQGLTVFVMSWVNPDERLAGASFGDYIRSGPLAALDAIAKATGEKDVAAIGYCVGGTLLAAALAYMAAKGDTRISSATLFTTQVDFTHAGDLKVFFDEDQVRAVEKQMAEKGYLEGAKMANAFNMLRSNDLIWSYVINNYVKGKTPVPFDLLYWNSDSTRMPAANHSFYLRNCYLENKLTKGEMVVDGVALDLKAIKIPVYNLAAREDHIAPAKSVFHGSRFFGGDLTYVMAGSGHIAGVINPPAKMKYQFWTGGPVKGRFESWVARAEEHPGSWWPHWLGWIAAQDGRKVKARKPGGGKLKPIEDAPGRYVRVKS